MGDPLEPPQLVDEWKENLKGNYTGDTINTFRTLFGNRFIGS